MKRSELIFSAIQVPIDFAMLVAASLSAFFLRDAIPRWTNLVPEKLFAFSFDQYVKITLIVAPLFLVIYAAEGLYSIRTTRKPIAETWTVARATTVGLMIIIVAIFLNREWFSSRVIILTGWVLAIVLVAAARLALRLLQRYLLLAHRVGVHRVLLLGATPIAAGIRSHLATRPSLGYRVVAQLDAPHLSRIREIRAAKGVDEVVIADPSLPDTVIEKIVDYGKINNITVRLVPTSLQATLYEFQPFAGEPMLTFLHTPLDGWGKILKRTFDIVASAVLIVLSSPVMLAIAAAIRLEDPDGPIVFKNERVGDDGRTFFVYKFRYMKWRYSTSRDNPHWEEALAFERQLIEERSVRQGPLYKIKDDPRKTRIGTDRKSVV